MPVVACLHHLDQPFLGNAAAPLRAAGLTLDERDLAAGDPLPVLGEVDAIVAFGGDQSARGHDGDPGLEAEVALLRDAVAAGVPVLGLCLGGQLLARALGATVVRAPRRVVGWRALTTTADDPLLGAAGSTVVAAHFNEDVFTLPPGAEALTDPAADGGVEAFRLGARAWGLQFHPEVDGPTLAEWYAEFPDWLAEAGTDEPAACAADAAYLPAQHAQADRLFAAFAAVVVAATVGP